jgi:hypothetical protein
MSYSGTILSEELSACTFRVKKLAYQCFTAVLPADLWQSLSEWRLIMPACVLVCRRENVGANINFPVKLGKSGSEIREVLVQVTGIML